VAFVFEPEIYPSTCGSRGAAPQPAGTPPRPSPAPVIAHTIATGFWVATRWWRPHLNHDCKIALYRLRHGRRFARMVGDPSLTPSCHAFRPTLSTRLYRPDMMEFRDIALAYGFSSNPGQSTGNSAILYTLAIPSPWTLKKSPDAGTHRVRFPQTHCGNGQKVLLVAPVLNAHAKGPSPILSTSRHHSLITCRENGNVNSDPQENKGVFHDCYRSTGRRLKAGTCFDEPLQGAFRAYLGKDEKWNTMEISAVSPARGQRRRGAIAVGKIKVNISAPTI